MGVPRQGARRRGVPLSRPPAPPGPTARGTEIPTAEARQWLDAQIGQERWSLRLTATAGLIAGLLVIPQAGLIAFILDRAIGDGIAPAALGGAFAGLAAVMIARALLGWVRETLGQAAALRIQGRLRDHCYDHLARLGPVRLADRPAGELAAAVVEQIEAVGAYYARYRPQRLIAVLVPVGILLATLTQDWLAALILLFAAPLIPLFMMLIGFGAEQISQAQQATLARLGGHFLDRLQGLTTLRLHNAEHRVVAEVRRAADGYRVGTMKVLRVAFLSAAVLEFFSAVAIALLAIYIGFGLLGFLTWRPATDLTLFSGLFILLMAPDFFQPIRQLAQHYHDRAGALGAAQVLLPWLHRPAPPLNPSRPSRPAGPGVRVRFDHVGVRFDGGTRIALDDLSLVIEPGERLVLVGPSGAGKSTILHLLAGFVEPDRGAVSIDGTAPDPARQVAWVGQRPYLFPATLADNIRLAALAAPPEAVAAAAKAAGVMGFATSLPHGLDTPIGERGFGLSGGEAQRVALARAALKQAPLWLLDEPTAGLDAETEAEVIAALMQAAPTGATILIASHHPPLRAWADRVVEVRDGRVVADRRSTR
ncbi:thiol reductant ABC exporter subunit CydD [Thioalkalicoccus limnaeus]|uniref:Thiol reductant ABC exporter subunit CydD n=1 Tax=Thioalkalicoccus limnaeus TaxID=120681 RepID=A0ABV4BHC6_9GAMM